MSILQINTYHSIL